MALLKKVFGKAGKDEEKPAAKTTLRKQGTGQGLTILEIADSKEWEVKSLPEWKPGDVIMDTYEIENVIPGGMGNVYIAHHRKWNRKLAIKAPNEMMLSDKDNFARVLREAHFWISMGLHPNIAYCYYVRNIEEVPHIVVEYVDGGNLKNWIEDGKCIDYRVNLDLAIQFCHGMEFAHSKGMIHRDIKPENILMSKEGILKITDFGLVKGGVSVHESVSADRNNLQPINPSLTRLGDFMGTEGYLSPEQAESARKVDEGTDIFAFGVCLYEMFCGNKPYEITYGPKQEPPEPAILSRDEKFPRRLAVLLEKLVQWDKHNRPAGFEIIRKELSQIYLELYNEASPYAKLDFMDVEADGLNNQGVSFYELGKVEEAEKLFKKALEIDPVHPQSTYNLCLIESRSGKIDIDEMVKKLKKCLENLGVTKKTVYPLLARAHVEWLNPGVAREILEDFPGLFEEMFGELKPLEAQCIATFTGHTGGIESVNFSPDGQMALSGSEDRTICLWDIETHQCIATLKGHKNGVNSVSFSPDGHMALSGSSDAAIRLWNLEKKRFKRYCITTLKEHKSNVNSVSFSPDGRMALSGGWDRIVRLWDLKTYKCSASLKGHTGSVNTVSFSPDGRMAVSGSSDKTIRLWNIETHQCISTLKGRTGEVNSVCFSPDSRMLLSGSNDDTVVLWDLDTCQIIVTLKGHTHNVSSVSFSPDGRMAMSGSWDRIVRLWDIEHHQCIAILKGHNGNVNSVCFSPDGRLALSGSSDRTVFLWDLSQIVMNLSSYYSRTELCYPKGHAEIKKERDDITNFMKANRNGDAFKFLLTLWEKKNFSEDKNFFEKYCSLYKKARPGGVVTMYKYMMLEGHKDLISSICFSPDGHLALSGSYDKTLCLWDLESRECIAILKGHTGGVTCVSLSPDGSMALSGSDYKSIRLWDIESRRCIAALKGHTDSVTSVSFSPDGRKAISGSKDKTIRFWDLKSQTCIFILRRHTSEVTSVRFNPDGRTAISGSNDKTIRLWNLKRRKCIATLKGHEDKITSVSFSPDGRLVISGSNDKTIRLWNLKRRKCIATIEGHKNEVTSVNFSLDGQIAISGSADKTVRVWRVIRDLEFPEPVDWDETVRPYLEIFLILRRYTWTENDFKELIMELVEKRGLGWVRSEGIRKELEKMMDKYGKRNPKSEEIQLYNEKLENMIDENEKNGLKSKDSQPFNKKVIRIMDEYGKKDLQFKDSHLYNKLKNISQAERKYKIPNKIRKKGKTINPMKHYSTNKKPGIMKRKVI